MLTMHCPQCWGTSPQPPGPVCHGCQGARVVEDAELSSHFLLSEFLTSQTALRWRIPNAPPPNVRAALGELATSILQPLRDTVGCPLHVDSGYRSPGLNHAVGGAASSAHVSGFAADLKPAGKGVSLRQLFNAVIELKRPYDQLIWEYGSWVHVGLRAPGGSQRGENLMIFAGGSYEKFNPTDPRLPRE
jgi:hypothetical protein